MPWVRRCRRIATVGRPVTSITAASRHPNGPPAGSRRFSTGWAGENSRPVCPARADHPVSMSTSSASEPATGGPGSVRPSASSSTTRSAPWMCTFSTSSRSNNGCSRPSPNSAANTAAATARSPSRSRAGSPPAVRDTAHCSISSPTSEAASARSSASDSSRPGRPRSVSNRCATRARSCPTSAQSTPVAVARGGAGGGTGGGTGSRRGRAWPLTGHAGEPSPVLVLIAADHPVPAAGPAKTRWAPRTAGWPRGQVPRRQRPPAGTRSGRRGSGASGAIPGPG